MHKINIGIKIPDLYICENASEATTAKHYGLPYVIRPRGMTDEQMVIVLMYRTLKSKFPHIDWKKVFGTDTLRFLDTIIVKVPGGKARSHSSKDNSNTADIATGERTFSGQLENEEDSYCERDLWSYIGDKSSSVKIEELQALNLLPTFLSNISDSIRKNLYGYDWSEGYNKKRGCAIGNYNAERVAKNLMILDVSGSIPRGISATMLTLIDTLRTQANADLIVTGSISQYYPAGSALPTPQELRNGIGYGNEAGMFYKILNEHVAGGEWGNVICFGDDDAPEDYAEYIFSSCEDKCLNEKMKATRIGKLWSYHTNKKTTPGYAKWVHENVSDDIDEELNTSWCKIMC